jgi:hypothetical protein
MNTTIRKGGGLMNRATLSKVILFVKYDAFSNLFDKVVCGLMLPVVVLSVCFHNEIYTGLITKTSASILLYVRFGAVLLKVIALAIKLFALKSTEAYGYVHHITSLRIFLSIFSIIKTKYYAIVYLALANLIIDCSNVFLLVCLSICMVFLIYLLSFAISRAAHFLLSKISFTKKSSDGAAALHSRNTNKPITNVTLNLIYKDIIISKRVVPYIIAVCLSVLFGTVMLVNELIFLAPVIVMSLIGFVLPFISEMFIKNDVDIIDYTRTLPISQTQFFVSKVISVYVVLSVPISIIALFMLISMQYNALHIIAVWIAVCLFIFLWSNIQTAIIMKNVDSQNRTQFEILIKAFLLSTVIPVYPIVFLLTSEKSAMKRFAGGRD